MNLKEIRKRNKKNQKEVADFLNVMQSTYSGYEVGRVEMTGETIIKLSNYFNVTTDELLGVKREEKTLTQKNTLMNKINNLTENECYKLNVYADALIINREEHKQKINKLLTEENEK